MRRYELMLLLRPDLEDDKLQAAVEKVTRAVVNAGGSLSKVSPWGKRRLAYDIKRHREASYFLIHFDIEPAQVREIERSMLISEEILRHLVTVLEDRGTADELAPAAVARTFGEDGTDDDAAIAPQGDVAGTATATIAADAADAGATASVDQSNDDDTSEGEDEDENENENKADAAPADEERAEGRAPRPEGSS